MKADNLKFSKITGLNDHHAGLIESLLDGMIRAGQAGKPENVERLLEKSLGAWGQMGEAGKIVAAEAACVLVVAGMVETGERIVRETGVKPARVEALLDMAKSLMGLNFYSENTGYGIVELLIRSGDHPRFGDGGRGALLDRLVDSPIDWPLGVDDMSGSVKTCSCTRVLDLYWSDRAGGYSKKPVDDKSMREAMDFVKALVRHGSDPLGGHAGLLAMAIPPWHTMGSDPNMWLFEQVAGMGGFDDRAHEQAWAIALREDVAKVYRKGQKLGKRGQALKRMDISIPALSGTCSRRHSLKMTALDKACVPMINMLKARGVDVDWRGPDGNGRFFSKRIYQPSDVLQRTLKAANGLTLPFVDEDLKTQCIGPDVAAVKHILKADPGITGRIQGGHPLGCITAYADNKKNHDNIGAAIAAFVQNAKDTGGSINVDLDTFNCIVRAGLTENMVENLDYFSFDIKAAPAMLKKLCGQCVQWDARRSGATNRLAAHLFDLGMSLPPSAKGQGGLVAKALQSRNPALAEYLLERGAQVRGMSIEHFLPRTAGKEDEAHRDTMARAMLELARCGVEMTQVSGAKSVWANPMIAAASQAHLETGVATPDEDRIKPRIGPRF